MIIGDGPVFSAGYDLGNLEGDTFSDNAERLVAHPFTDAIEAIERYRYPVLAAINGHAIGGGLELALSCDIRIAARDVKLGMPPAKIGLIYSHTGLKKFIEMCGVANTNELFFVGRNVDSDRALAMGLVNQVVERGGLEDRRSRSRARSGPTRRCRSPATRRSSARCASTRAGCPRASSRNSSSCARRASGRRTFARACGRSARSASPSGRGARSR